MNKSFLIIILLLFASVRTSAFMGEAIPLSEQYYTQLAMKQVAAIHNYSKLTNNQKNILMEQSILWLKKIDSLRIADSEKKLPSNILNLPTQLVFATFRKDKINMVPDYNVAYIPDMEMFYLIFYKYYQSFLKYGEDTPVPEVVMGIMCRETKFTWMLGDGGHSVSPCQLHKQTAKWLLEDKRMRKIFGYMIYFDQPNNKGLHHFTSNEKMIEFMYEFLVRAKGYKKGKELRGIARYNGCSPKDSYVKRVVKNTIKYLALTKIYRLNNAYKPLSDKNVFLNELRNNLYASVHSNNIDSVEVAQIIKATVETTYSEKKFEFTQFVKKRLGEVTKQFSLPVHKSFIVSNLDFGLPYIQKNPQIHLFAYFRGHTDTTIFYHNSIVSRLTGKNPDYSENGEKDAEFVFVYYVTADPITGVVQRNYVKSVAEYRKAAKMFELHSQKRSGKIYVIPNFPVYYYPNLQGEDEAPALFVDNVLVDKQIDRYDNQ